MECFRIDGKPSELLIPVEMTDSGAFTTTCDKGHVTLTALQQHKFEILFTFGAMALLDGYPRESIASIATSLERLYELYVQAISFKHGVSADVFDQAWKLVNSQSERQFGAFLFLYLVENKKNCPIILNEKPVLPGVKPRTWVEFRNEVVHKGYIPSYQEALAYGDIAYKFIWKIIGELKDDSNKGILSQVVVQHLSRKNTGDKPMATMSIPTPVTLTRGDKPPETLQEALEELKQYRKFLHHV